MSRPDRAARVARDRGSRVARFSRGRGARGAGQRPPATLPTLHASILPVYLEVMVIKYVAAAAAAKTTTTTTWSTTALKRQGPNHVGRPAALTTAAL